MSGTVPSSIPSGTLPSSIPTTQRAWIIERRGTPDQVLRLHHDWPVPKPRSGEVLVRVEAAALNPVGYKVMSLFPDFLARRPLPAENDFAGTVVDANGTSEFKEGDAVWGFVEVGLSIKIRQGALCEYLRIPTTHIVPRPAHVAPTGAAGMALAGQTAYQMLFRSGNLARRADGTLEPDQSVFVNGGSASVNGGSAFVLEPDQSVFVNGGSAFVNGSSASVNGGSAFVLEPDQSVFVNGGSSSVGAYAIQMAKAKGAARVVASASAQGEEMVRALGADGFVDYKKAPVHEQLAKDPSATATKSPSSTKTSPSTKFHLIVDAVGGTDPALYTHSEAYLAPGGVYVTTGFFMGPTTLSNIATILKHGLAAIWPRFLGGIPRKHSTYALMSKKEDLEDMNGMLAAGTLKPVVDSVFAFEDVLKAYERVMSHRAKGKVVVKVVPDVE